MSRPVLLFDLETSGLPDADRYLPAPDPPKMPSNYKTPETVAKWEAEQPARMAAMRAESLRRAAIDPHVSRIVVLGTDIDGETTIHVCHDEAEEAAALRALWSGYSEYRRPKLVGWNIKFDLRTALIRSRYLGVTAPGIDLHPFNSGDFQDLMDLFNLSSIAGRGDDSKVMDLKQETVYRRLGGPDLGDSITGADVPRCIAEGDYDRPAAHNRADLARLRFIGAWLGVVRPAPQPVTA